MDEIERRQEDRRQDHETAAQLHEALALQLMDAHLRHVEQGLTLHELTTTP